jgi:DNA-binding CsgD family transcriptional regulator
VKKAREAAIDIVEAAYDLEASAAEWTDNLLERAAPIFDQGRGFGGGIWSGMDETGNLIATGFSFSAPGMLESYLPRLAQATAEVGPERMADWMEKTQSIVSVHSSHPAELGTFEIFTRHLECADILEVNAHDHDGHGFSWWCGSNEPIRLSEREKKSLEHLTIHMAAGHRIRRGLKDQPKPTGVSLADLPLDAEALLDPTRFVVTDALGDARDATISETIREAAKQVDKARGKLRRQDPDEALEIWKGLTRGRWSLVDWFDTDGRRYVLAKPNLPRVGDPRGLTEQEALIATYAARGETGKILSYRFGLSAQRVSTILASAKRKLGVKTQAELVAKLGPFGFLDGDSSEESEAN